MFSHRSPRLIAKTLMIAGFGAGLSMNALPSLAFSIYSGIDPNGNSSVNLGCPSGCPNATSAESAFLSSLVGVGTETFESFSPGTTAPLAVIFPGAGTATLSGGGGAIASVPAGSTNGVGRYGVSPTNFWEVAAGTGGDFMLDFSMPIAAFGFYGIDIGDFSGTILLMFDNGNISTQPIPTAPISQADGSVLFWGIATTPAEGDISKVIFKTTPGTGDYFAFDNMTIGSRAQVKQPSQASQVPAPLPAMGAAAAAASIRKLRDYSSRLKKFSMV